MERKSVDFLSSTYKPYAESATCNAYVQVLVNVRRQPMTLLLTDLRAWPVSTQATPKRPIHLLHLIEDLGPGGAERLLYTNLKHLDPERFQHTVLTVFSSTGHWADPIRQLGVNIESLGCTSLRDFPVGIARLRKRLKIDPPDLIHTHLWAANVIGRIAGRLAGVPVISSVHNPDHEPEAWEDGSDVSRTKRVLAREIDRLSARFGCDRMIAVSEYTRQSAHRCLGFPLERIELLYNPIDAEVFASAGDPEHDRKALLSELQLAEDSLLLLNIGRLTPQKGQIYAVRALPNILKQYPTTNLVLVGIATDNQWFAGLQAEIQLLGVADHVHFLGARSDVPNLLRACDIFIFPSLYEGLGMALIEAMAAGCACIASAGGPLPEIVQPGVDGLLVEPRNEKLLGEAVCELLGNSSRRTSMGAAARESALKRFQPQPAADKLATIYESMFK